MYKIGYELGPSHKVIKLLVCCLITIDYIDSLKLIITISKLEIKIKFSVLSWSTKYILSAPLFLL